MTGGLGAVPGRPPLAHRQVGPFDEGRVDRAPQPELLEGGVEGGPTAAPQAWDDPDQPAALIALLHLSGQHAGVHLPPPAVPSTAATHRPTWAVSAPT